MNIIVFSSQLHDTQSVMAGRSKALNEFFAGEPLHLYSCGDDFPSDGGSACFIATGGTEELFAGIWQKLPQPVLLLSDGYHNSFAAAKEIASFLEQRGVEHKLVNLPLAGEEDVAVAYDTAADADAGAASPRAGVTAAGLCANPYAEQRVRQALASARIGLIGGRVPGFYTSCCSEMLCFRPSHVHSSSYFP